jgi:hypothetical protein
LRLSGRVLYFWVTVGVPLVTATAFYLIAKGDLKSMGFLEGLGVIGGGLLAGLMLARGGLRKIVLGFRPLLDVLLDVDNWLRELPLGRNPKSRVCGHYVSLLRYVLNWQDPDGHGYDAVVIVAHSQGTVISTDMHRFIHAEAQGGPSGRAATEVELQSYDPQLKPLELARAKRIP